MNIQLPKFAQTAICRLENEGFEAYVVGGCVRDTFLNKTPYDWDITTSAKPDEILNVFADFRTIETGLKHGTVTVIVDGNPLEITTMRVDGEYSDNRHPDSVFFTDKINLDLSRRDFTVNAMAYSPNRGLADPFGGAEDLKKGVMKCVGEPEKRFNEDALRILRGLRFSSVLGFEIEEKTSDAIKKLAPLLDNVAAERKHTELVKLLCGKDVKRILLKYPDVIFRVIPQLEKMYKFPQNTKYHVFDVWEHTAAAVEAAPANSVYRTAMLLHDAGKPEAYFADDDGTAHFKGHQQISFEICLEVLKNLRFSKAETEEISRLILHHDTRPTGEKEDTLLLAVRLGADFLKKLYPVLAADAKAQNPEFLPEVMSRLEKSEKILDEAVENGVCLSIKELAADGKAVTAAGFRGKRIGEILALLTEQTAIGNVENKRESLIEFAKNLNK